jgi:hypothetical protein
MVNNVLGGQAERAGTVLVNVEPDRLHLLAPIEVRVNDLGVCRHDLPNLFSDRAHFHRVGPDHAELNGERAATVKKAPAVPRLSRRPIDSV